MTRPLTQARRHIGLWRDPDLRIVGAGPRAAEPLPINVFGPAAAWIADQAKVKSAPPDYVAMALLSTAAASIGSARRAEAQPGWTNPSILWMALVGSPSSKKSPAVDTVVEPLNAVSLAHMRQYRAAMQAWKAAVVTGDDRGPRPTREIVFISDITIEKVVLICARQRKGLYIIRDELAGFIAQLNKYSRDGGDQSFYLQAYDGGPYIVERVKYEDAIEAESLHVNILGCLQPDMVSDRFGRGPDDGFLARMLFVWPDRLPLERCEILPDAATPRRIIERLRSLEMHDDGGPRDIPFSLEARELFFEIRQALEVRAEQAHGPLASWIGKAPGTVARVALSLAFLDWALEVDDVPEPAEIPAGVVGRAAQLTVEYLLPHAERVFGDLAAPPCERRAATLAHILLGSPRTRISPRDVVAMRIPTLSSVRQVREALNTLADAHWVRLQTARPEAWSVNPNIYGDRINGLDQ